MQRYLFSGHYLLGPELRSQPANFRPTTMAGLERPGWPAKKGKITLPDHSLMATPDALVVYPNRGKMFFMVLGSAAFVAIGIFLWTRDNPPIKIRMVAVAAIVFFGAACCYGLYRVLRPEPALVINHFGIFDATTALGWGLISWEEIESISIAEMTIGLTSRQRFVAIHLKDPEVFLQRQSFFKARMLKMNTGLVGTPA